MVSPNHEILGKYEIPLDSQIYALPFFDIDDE